MEYTPVKDLLKSLRRKNKTMWDNAMTHRDKVFCAGYERALDDVLRGALSIQETFNVHYEIKHDYDSTE